MDAVTLLRNPTGARQAGSLASGAARPVVRLHALLILLLLVAPLVRGDHPSRLIAATRTVAGTPPPLPAPALRPLVRGESMVSGATAGFVWLVRPGTAYGLQRTIPTPLPPGFALAQIGSLAVFDRLGFLLAEVGPGEAVFFPGGTERSFGSTDGDPTRFLQISLVGTEMLSQPLPAGARVSEPFTLLAGAITIELASGGLDASGALDLSASAYPTLLLVSSGIITVREADGTTRVLGTGESALLDSAAQVWNASQQPTTFVVARLSPDAAATQERQTTARPERDPVLDAVWERNGCPLNPANPPCLAIAQAAACSVTPDARCAADSDGDGCIDIGEVRLGLDAFDAADCIPDPTGQPAVNCLFPLTERTCGRRGGKAARRVGGKKSRGVEGRYAPRRAVEERTRASSRLLDSSTSRLVSR